MVVPDSLDAFRDHVRAFIAREIAPSAGRASDRFRARFTPRPAPPDSSAGLKYAREWGGSQRPYAFTHAMLDEFGRSGEMGCLLSLALLSEFATPHLALYGGD